MNDTNTNEDKNPEIELIKRINEQNKEENFVISPLGIEIILSLFANGAENETQKEILTLLNYENIEEANSVSKKILEEFKKNQEHIKMATAILTKVKAKEKFIQKGKNDYDAKIEILKNYHNVNKWAENKTKKFITNVIDSLDPDVIMILLNALYFEGFWSTQFDKNLTNEKIFYNLDNKKKSIRTMMMFQRGTLMNYYEDDYLQAVKLKYEKTQGFNAVIILPNENNGINEFIKQFDKKMYEKMVEGLKKEEKVNLVLPKFKLDFKLDFSSILQNLGIKKAFTRDAELKKLCDYNPIFINHVLQKNYINVNEEGTQAASLSELEVILECYRDRDPNAKNFIVNRPFIFLVRNEELPKDRDIIFFTKICKFEENVDQDID